VRRLRYPARGSNSVPPGKSRLHRLNACGAGNRIRFPAACLLTRRLPSGRPDGSRTRCLRLIRPLRLPVAPPASWAPGIRTLHDRVISAAPSTKVDRAQQMGEDPTPSARAPLRLQTGACRPAGFPSMRGERRTRTVTLARSFVFETTPAAPAGSLSKSALPPDANGREMAEARELESQRSRAHSLSRR
jgi:hypothetical protein